MNGVLVGGMETGGTLQVALAMSCTAHLLCAPRASLHGRFLEKFSSNQCKVSFTQGENQTQHHACY